MGRQWPIRRPTSERPSVPPENIREQRVAARRLIAAQGPVRRGDLKGRLPVAAWPSIERLPTPPKDWRP
jgi:hypothetical protein